MKEYSDIDRTASLHRLVPDLFEYKSVLNVGGSNQSVSLW